MYLYIYFFGFKTFSNDHIEPQQSAMHIEEGKMKSITRTDSNQLSTTGNKTLYRIATTICVIMVKLLRSMSCANDWHKLVLYQENPSRQYQLGIK